MYVFADKLWGCLDVDRDDALQEIKKLDGLVLVCEKEVDAVFGLFDVDSVAMCAVLEDELFEEKERSLVQDLLPDLYGGSPDCLSLVRKCCHGG